MSAYVVENKTALFIVAAAAQFEAYTYFEGKGYTMKKTAGGRERAAFASMLIAENTKSVNYRYNETRDFAPISSKEARATRWSNITPEQVFGVLDCFEYQACEHPEWETSRAKAFVDAVRKAAARKVKGYDWQAPKTDAEVEAERKTFVEEYAKKLAAVN